MRVKDLNSTEVFFGVLKKARAASIRLVVVARGDNSNVISPSALQVYDLLLITLVSRIKHVDQVKHRPAIPP
jgi:hypothetical protein